MGKPYEPSLCSNLTIPFPISQDNKIQQHISCFFVLTTLNHPKNIYTLLINVDCPYLRYITLIVHWRLGSLRSFQVKIVENGRAVYFAIHKYRKAGHKVPILIKMRYIRSLKYIVMLHL